MAASEAPAAAEECCVKVALKIRPLVDSELSQQCEECVLVTPGQPQVRGEAHARPLHGSRRGAPD